VDRSNRDNCSCPSCLVVGFQSRRVCVCVCVQGKEWLPELRRCVKDCPAARPFVEAIVAKLKTELELPECQALGLHPYGKNNHRSLSVHVLSRVAGDISSPLIMVCVCPFTKQHQGLDALSWIDDEEAAPGKSYLNFAPVSYPMIGLTQLTNYVACMIEMGVTQAEMLSYLKGATGHSQGTCVQLNSTFPL
jgi:malonyl CoA-acyl carrier protein transacylase